MRKLISRYSSFAVLSILLFIISCSKSKDITPPVISLNGPDSLSIQLASAYADAGASATDNSDGTVAVTSDFSSVNPDTGKAGIYTINYNAKDVEGNAAHESRTVTVEIRRANYTGNYSTTHTCPSVGSFSPAETITAGAANDEIILSNFAGTNASCTAAVFRSEYYDCITNSWNFN